MEETSKLIEQPSELYGTTNIIIQEKPNNEHTYHIKSSKALSAVRFESSAVYIKAEQNNKSHGQTTRAITDDDNDDTEWNNISWFRKFVHMLDMSEESQQKWICWMLLFILIMLTSVERVTFKMVIDNMTPYRTIVEIYIVCILTLSYGCVVIWKYFRKVIRWSDIRIVSPLHLLFMASLDVCHFSGLLISAAGISPTSTLILLHASTPCVVYGSRYFFPNRNFSSIQAYGNYVIILAILISIVTPIIAWWVGHTTKNVIYSSLLYTVSAQLQGFTMVYKEYSIPKWASPPIDIHVLSFCLFFIQSILTICISPIIYYFQDLTGDYDLSFPLSSFRVNMMDGITCLFGDRPHISRRYPPYDYRYANCVDFNIWLILAYVFSNICILECVDRILKMRQHMLGQATVLAVFIAFIALAIYDTKADYGVGIYGSNIGIADLLSLVVLLVGLEAYSRSEAIIESTPVTVDHQNRKESEP